MPTAHRDGSWFLRAAVLAGVLAATFAPARAALADVPRPSVRGSITGGVTTGSSIVFRVDAREPESHGRFADVQVVLLLHSVILDEIDVRPAARSFSMTSSLPVTVGSRAVATGAFLQVSGRGIGIHASGDLLVVSVRATVIHDVPDGSRFALGAIDGFNQVARVFRPVDVPPAAGGGFSWGSAALLVAVALFAGGFVGNLVASRRGDRTPKVDVYAAIEQQMRKQPVTP